MAISVSDLHTHNVLRNWVAGFLCTYGWLSFWCFDFLDQEWTASAPKTPNVALGIIYEHHRNGLHTYFSAFQATSCALLLMTFAPIFLIGFRIFPKKNEKVSKRKFSYRVSYDSDDPQKIRWKAALAGAVFTPFFIFITGPHIVEILNTAGVVINFG